MSINIGIDHGYYAIKTSHFSFPAGIVAYSSEPYTLQNTLKFGGRYYVCGTGRQPVLRNKTANDNYYLLTLAAIAKELRQRGAPTTATVRLAAGLPLTSYGREKLPFRDYLLRPAQPVCFEFEGTAYEITIEDVTLFPQGYSALALYPDLLVDETAEQVRRDCGLSVTDSQIESVLNGRPCSLREDVREIILRQGQSYTERLLSATMETGFDLGAMPMVMLGGGAAIVKRHVQPKDALCRPLYLLDDKANAEGFERLLGQMSGSVGRA